MVNKTRQLGIYDSLHAQDVVDFLHQTSEQADLVLAADVFIYVGTLDAVFEALSPRVLSGAWLAFTVEEADPGFDVQLHSTLRYSHALSYLQGLAVRQGPHQGAQKSTKIGTSLRPMWRSNAASSKAAGWPSNKVRWHLPKSGAWAS